jgi:putative ABC transport system ATP-binding protein
MSDSPILELEKVSMAFDGKQVLRDVSLILHQNETYGITGPSGCGKSTLLRVVNDLLSSTSGTVRFQGKDVREWNPQELRRRVVMVPQEAKMFPGTVRWNLLWGLRIHGMTAEDEQLKTILQEVHLWPIDLDGNAENLSGGQKQRVAIARALLLKPNVLLLDEPTSALDTDSALAVEKTINSLLSDHQMGVLIVTHNKEQAERFTSRVLELENLSEAS